MRDWHRCEVLMKAAAGCNGYRREEECLLDGGGGGGLGGGEGADRGEI